MDAERNKYNMHVREFKAALPILTEWFPGVIWHWYEDGDYGWDTIIVDASEEYPYSFTLRSEVHQDGTVNIEAGDYRIDTSPGTVGCSYFSGVKIKGPADLGRHIETKNAGK